MFGLGESRDDAIEVLKRDHDEAEKLFDEYEDAKGEADPRRKVEIATAACRALTLHARVEEDLFYPSLRAADDSAAGLLDEALVEHATVKQLVAVIEAGAPDDPLYDATVRVLGEYVKHHVKEEEGEIFPLARKSGLDLDALGAAIEQRKRELEAAPARRTRRNGAGERPRARSHAKPAPRARGKSANRPA